MKRIEVVRQQDLKDCGSCCLLSIIKYYGGYVPLEKIRMDTETSMEGTTAYHLIKAAHTYGFDAYGMKFNSISDLKEVVFPIIGHVVDNGLQHFVVLEKIVKEYVYLMDPAKGSIKIKLASFEQIWSKNTIILYPKYQIPHMNQENHIIKIIKTFLKNEKKQVIKIILLTTIFTFITIVTSFYFKVGITFLNQNEDKNIITVIICLFTFLYLTKILIFYLREFLKNRVNKKMDGLLLYNFIHHLFLLPNHFVKDRTTGEIMVRIKELENLKEVFSEIILTIGLDSILAFSVGILLYSISKTMFLILCLFVLIYGILGVITGKSLYKRASQANDAEIAFQSKTIENLDTFITIKNLNVEKNMFKKLENYLFKYLEKVYLVKEKIINTVSVSFLLEETLNLIIISFGIVKIMHNELSVVDLITFDYLVTFFVAPFKNIIRLIPEFSYVKVCIQKINDFYNLEEENKSGLKEFKNGNIEVIDLTFSYTPFLKVFENLNMEISQNSFVYFKGNSGCGKSTLCKMISRVLDIKKGSIKINGIHISDYSLDTIRKNITYVSQKEILFQDTIKNNIVLNREVKGQKLLDILKICEIEEIVEKKPLRYDTLLVKDAYNLSGGEKQRIILARALLNDFQILILDEALSELNNELEIKIIKNLKKYLKEKTVIYVSHKNHEKYFDKVYSFGVLNE